MTLMSLPLRLTVHYIMALTLLNKNSVWSKGVIASKLTDFLKLSQLVKISLKKKNN